MNIFKTLVGTALIVSLNSVFAYDVILHGKKAKALYNSLTGSQVQNEGAAGHQYRTGKDVLCRYTTADITKNGHNVPIHAACRYACAIKLNANGQASPGSNNNF